MVEVREGLDEGDEVVINPKVLLGDKDKTKTREPGDSKETKIRTPTRPTPSRELTPARAADR